MVGNAGYRRKLTNPVEFLLSRYPGRAIFRYIQSHPDLDHMRGLAALRASEIEIINFWDTEHNKIPDLQDSDRPDWFEYKRLRKESGPRVMRLTRGSSGAYYNDDEIQTGGDRLDILAPTQELLDSANENEKWNRASYVLRLYHAGRAVIFGADADEPVWDDIAEYYGENLQCDVLKASHHGRDTGYHQKALSLMKPLTTVVSVGRKPDTDATNKYRNYSDSVLSTRWEGNISLTIQDDGSMTWTTERSLEQLVNHLMPSAS